MLAESGTSWASCSRNTFTLLENRSARTPQLRLRDLVAESLLKVWRALCAHLQVEQLCMHLRTRMVLASWQRLLPTPAAQRPILNGVSKLGHLLTSLESPSICLMPHSTSWLHSGQMSEDVVSHSSMQAVWKIWRHGNLRTHSPVANASKQMQQVHVFQGASSTSLHSSAAAPSLPGPLVPLDETALRASLGRGDGDGERATAEERTATDRTAAVQDRAAADRVGDASVRGLGRVRRVAMRPQQNGVETLRLLDALPPLATTPEPLASE